MSVERVKDRKDENINEGDHVWTQYRGGVREGDVLIHFPFLFRQTFFTGRIWLILDEKKGPESRHG
jgi:hypothetical protein